MAQAFAIDLDTIVMIQTIDDEGIGERGCSGRMRSGGAPDEAFALPQPARRAARQVPDPGGTGGPAATDGVDQMQYQLLPHCDGNLIEGQVGGKSCQGISTGAHWNKGISGGRNAPGCGFR